MDELDLVRQFFGDRRPPAPDIVATAKARIPFGEPDRRRQHLLRLRRLLPLAAAAGVVVIVLATAFIGHFYGNPATHGGTANGTGPATTAGFVGSKWTVVTIGHDGKTTPVPAGYGVYLQFTPDGQFDASDPVNTHGGRYEVTPGGFTTSALISTAVGWGGGDSVESLAIGAISAFDPGVHALTQISGNTLTITVNGYTLIARRDGTQANCPTPKGTPTS